MMPALAKSSKEIPCDFLGTAADIIGAYLKNAQLSLGREAF
jgi:hypothetical protein